MTTSIAAALLTASVGCGGNHRDANRAAEQQNPAAGSSTATAAGQQSAGAPMTLEGCVQRGGGTFSNGYMLTMLNEPPGLVGTSGNLTSNGSAVEREQLRYAARTYRLDPQGDVKLSDMVGRQVRVSGTLAESANVPQERTEKGGVGSNESMRVKTENKDDHDTHLNPSDLAKLNVTSATVLSDSCGDGSDRSNGNGLSGGAAHR